MDDKSMEKYHEEETHKCKSSIDWKQLREEFFNECTEKMYNEVHLTTLDSEYLFNWFKNKIEKLK